MIVFHFTIILLLIVTDEIVILNQIQIKISFSCFICFSLLLSKQICRLKLFIKLCCISILHYYEIKYCIILKSCLLLFTYISCLTEVAFITDTDDRNCKNIMSHDAEIFLIDKRSILKENQLILLS